MTFSDQQHHQQSVCRMLGHALTLGDDPKAWNGLSFVMRHRLNGYERACVLMSASRALPPDDVAYVMETIEARACIGIPIPPLLDHMDDATWWAGHASIEERKAVLVAAFASLPAREQDGFLSYASGKDAA